MRTYSTPQSALDGDITKLAILECAASVLIYVGIGLYFGTFKHLAFAVAVAPLMLLRTELSAEWGLRVYGRLSLRFFEWVQLHIQVPLIEPIISLTFASALGTAIRVIATLYGALRWPLQTLKGVPRNWVRQSLCTDLAHPPELVPLEALRGEGIIAVRFADIWPIFKVKDPVFLIVGIIMFSPIMLLGWLPSFIYRVSFKATALAYVPFVWVAHATLRSKFTVKTRLERFTKGELEKLRRGVSYIVLATLVAKGALFIGWIEEQDFVSKFPSKKILTELVIPNAWPWWQITFGADALLTFVLLVYADIALSRIEGQQPWREELVMTTVAAVSFLRATLGLATISHFFYIALQVAAPEFVRQLPSFS